MSIIENKEANQYNPLDDLDEDGEPYKAELSANNLDLAYCITVHKSQGTEWERVSYIQEDNTFMDSQNMLYTALSRCKGKEFILLDKDKKYSKVADIKAKHLYSNMTLLLSKY